MFKLLNVLAAFKNMSIVHRPVSFCDHTLNFHTEINKKLLKCGITLAFLLLCILKKEDFSPSHIKFPLL